MNSSCSIVFNESNKVNKFHEFLIIIIGTLFNYWIDVVFMWLL